jgi:3-oxoacid CoA-transferase subunit A
VSWWPDEQPSEEIIYRVEARLMMENWKVDAVFSHTCPYKYIPREVFLPNINQHTVDTSTEEWLDSIESRLDYFMWYCGHYHTYKFEDKIRFLFEDYLELF